MGTKRRVFSKRQVGLNIDYLRKRNGLTILQLSKKTGLSRQTIQNHQSGRRGVSGKALRVYASELGVPVDYLVSEVPRETWQFKVFSGLHWEQEGGAGV